jgi:hypothetical protein
LGWWSEYLISKKTKLNSVALSPRANYTDWSTANLISKNKFLLSTIFTIYGRKVAVVLHTWTHFPLFILTHIRLVATATEFNCTLTSWKLAQPHNHHNVKKFLDEFLGAYEHPVCQSHSYRQCLANVGFPEALVSFVSSQPNKEHVM